jgi:hypothetical protein
MTRSFAVGIAVLLVASMAPAPASASTALHNSVVSDLIPLQAEFQRSHANSFGGVWIDANHVPHVAIVQGDERLRAVAEQFRTSVPIVFHSVARSEADLADISGALVSETELGGRSLLGVTVSSIEDDVINNVVRINLYRGSAGDRARILERFGPGISVESSRSRAAKWRRMR